MSPQFKGITATQRKTRQTRRRRHTSCATQNGLQGKENLATLNKSHRKINTKLVPLNFLGEEIPVPGPVSPTSSLDEITAFDEQELDSHAPQNNANSKVADGGAARNHPSESGEHNALTDVRLERSFQSPNHPRTKNPASSSSEYTDIRKRSDRISTEQNCNPSDSSPRELADDRSLNPTQKLPRKRKKKMKKRLFGAVDFSDSETSNTASNESDLEPGTSPPPGAVETGDLENTAVCRRKSLRLQTLREKLLSIPHTPVNSDKPIRRNILAYDTPEEDYGLSVRQRRLKCIRQRKLRGQLNT